MTRQLLYGQVFGVVASDLRRTTTPGNLRTPVAGLRVGGGYVCEDVWRFSQTGPRGTTPERRGRQSLAHTAPTTCCRLFAWNNVEEKEIRRNRWEGPFGVRIPYARRTPHSQAEELHEGAAVPGDPVVRPSFVLVVCRPQDPLGVRETRLPKTGVRFYLIFICYFYPKSILLIFLVRAANFHLITYLLCSFKLCDGSWRMLTITRWHCRKPNQTQWGWNPIYSANTASQVERRAKRTHCGLLCFVAKKY